MPDNCLSCSKPLVDGADFCPHCGTKRTSGLSAVTVDALVSSRVDAALTNRLKDQNTLVREIGDKAEDVVWRRFKHYLWFFGSGLAMVLAFFAFIGLKTLDDISKRVEPIASAAVQRAEGAKKNIEESARKVDAVKASVDQAAREADAQAKRVADRLSKLDRVALDFEANRARSEEMGRKLDSMAQGLERKVEQVSRQVDRASVRQVYPSLGGEKFVALNGGRWMGTAEKKPGDRWINVSLDPRAPADYQASEIEALLTELKRNNYVPLLGGFGVGGAYYSAYMNFAGQSPPEIVTYYFKTASEAMARDAAQIAGRILKIPSRVEFLNPTKMDSDLKLVVETSGLDLQVYIPKR